MSDVIAFPGRRRPGAAPAASCSEVSINADQIAMQPLEVLRENLYQSIWLASDPLGAYEILGVIGRMCEVSTCTDAEARACGWADATTMRQRGADILALLFEFRTQIVVRPKPAPAETR